MYRCTLDSEQRALLLEAIRATDAFLGARLERADPGGVISSSRKLQQSKLDQVRAQLAEPTPVTWDTLPAGAQAELIRLLGAVAQVDDPRAIPAVCERMTAVILDPSPYQDPELALGT